MPTPSRSPPSGPGSTQGAEAPADEVALGPAATHWAFVAAQAARAAAGQGRGLGPQPDRPLHPRPLEREGIAPSPEADRATLIRRVSLDLIGLPPTPAEVDAFLADDRPDAYERLVDRLLASPHYGERWARPWLDLARYADSNGYSIDAPRSIWKYRDWVIDALNRDLPFDQFTIDQLAGDLLPDATLDQQVATGFHRNTPINQEGGIDLEQFRVESVVDRVNTTGDRLPRPDGRLLPVPRPQVRPDHASDEYYRLFAFFNNADEPDLPVATPEELARRDEVRGQGRRLSGRDSGTRIPTLREQQRAWEEGLDMAGRQKQSQAVRDAVRHRRSRSGPTAKQRVVFERSSTRPRRSRSTAQAIAAMREAGAEGRHDDGRPRAAEAPARRTCCIKGDFTRPGRARRARRPAGPAAARAGPGPPNRLDLARWLVDPGTR